MNTEIIDKLFLELSQFTRAKTKRDLTAEAEKVREFEKGFAEGRAKQAILECRARNKFIDKLSKKLCKKCQKIAVS